MSESIWDDPRITAYVLGEMSDQERHDFEIEMEADGELASAVEEARTVTDQLASLYGDETIPSLGDERRAAIVAGGAVSPAVDPSPSWPRIGLVLAIAAALLLMLGVAPVMYRQHQAEKQVTMAQLEDEKSSTFLIFIQRHGATLVATLFFLMIVFKMFYFVQFRLGARPCVP